MDSTVLRLRSFLSRFIGLAETRYSMAYALRVRPTVPSLLEGLKGKVIRRTVILSFKGLGNLIDQLHNCAAGLRTGSGLAPEDQSSREARKAES